MAWVVNVGYAWGGLSSLRSPFHAHATPKIGCAVSCLPRVLTRLVLVLVLVIVIVIVIVSGASVFSAQADRRGMGILPMSGRDVLPILLIRVLRVVRCVALHGRDAHATYAAVVIACRDNTT